MKLRSALRITQDFKTFLRYMNKTGIPALISSAHRVLAGVAGWRECLWL
jgi:hypothetical protein